MIHMNKNMKSDIIQAYYELVAEYGIENTSLAKVAKKIGVNTSLIFHYFTNKEELVSYFFDFVLEQCREAVSLPAITNNDIRKQFDEYLDKILVQQQYTKLETTAYYTCYVLALRDEQYREKFMEHRHKLCGMYQTNLKHFEKEGIIKPESIKLAANYMEIITDGIANLRDFMDESEDDAELILYYRNQLKRSLNYIEE